METNASYLGYPDKLFSITPSLKPKSIHPPPIFIKIPSNKSSSNVCSSVFCYIFITFSSAPVFSLLLQRKWENLFEANRIVKGVLWVPVLMVKMDVNSCLCARVRVHAGV